MVGMLRMQLYSNSGIFLSLAQKFIQFPRNNPKCFLSASSSLSQSKSRNLSLIAKPTEQNVMAGTGSQPSTLPAEQSVPSGFEDLMMGYLFGKRKATEVAHSVWKQVVQKGDAVVDATCGNGYDTLAMLKMVADKSCRGRVYAMDIQKAAIENTLSLLDQSLNADQKELVQLSATCHSKMEEIVPKGITVRLVAFNLGYLPGGDKSIVTLSETTLQALDAAKRILSSGGLISILVYVGHPGGREEFEAVQSFASGLPVENWVCCKFESLNRPLAPVFIFLFKR